MFEWQHHSQEQAHVPGCQFSESPCTGCLLAAEEERTQFCWKVSQLIACQYHVTVGWVLNVRFY